jgi:hypothetical protein
MRPTWHMRLTADRLNAGIVDDGALGLALFVLLHHMRDAELAHPEEALQIYIHDLWGERLATRKKRRCGWHTSSQCCSSRRWMGTCEMAGWMPTLLKSTSIRPHWAIAAPTSFSQSAPTKALSAPTSCIDQVGRRTLGCVKGNKVNASLCGGRALLTCPFVLNGLPSLCVGVLRVITTTQTINEVNKPAGGSGTPQKTWKPCSAKRRQQARPMPCAPPVTIATCCSERFQRQQRAMQTNLTFLPSSAMLFIPYFSLFPGHFFYRFLAVTPDLVGPDSGR